MYIAGKKQNMAIIIYNNLIPLKGYTAVTLWPLVFARKGAKPLKSHVESHEKIHLRQQLEVLVASAAVLAVVIWLMGWSWWWMLASLAVYYAGYGLDYAVRRILYSSHIEAYRNIACEQEAYQNQYYCAYLQQRRPFAWIKYIGRRTYRIRPPCQ